MTSTFYFDKDLDVNYTDPKGINGDFCGLL